MEINKLSTCYYKETQVLLTQDSEGREDPFHGSRSQDHCPGIQWLSTVDWYVPSMLHQAVNRSTAVPYRHIMHSYTTYHYVSTPPNIPISLWVYCFYSAAAVSTEYPLFLLYDCLCVSVVPTMCPCSYRVYCSYSVAAVPTGVSIVPTGHSVYKHLQFCAQWFN